MNEHAGMHYVTWKRVEPLFSWECYELPPVKYGAITKKKIYPSESASTRIGETVYNRRNGESAVIVESTITTIKIRYNRDNIEKSFALKNWICNVPCYTAKSYLPIYREIHNSNVFLGLRLDNISDPGWVDAIVKVSSDNMDTPVIEYSELGNRNIEALSYEEKNQDVKSYNIIYSLNNEKTFEESLRHFYAECLFKAISADINYIAFPIPVNRPTTDQMNIIAEEAVKFVTSFSLGQYDQQVRVIFVCSNINEYIAYKKAIDKVSE